MAYAFDRVMNALGGSGDDTKNQGGQTDIFQQQGPGQPANNSQRSDAVQASDSSGSIGNGSGSTGGNAPGAQAQGQSAQDASNTSQRNQFLNLGAGKTKSPIDTNQLTSDIGQASDKLQNEANSYIQGAGDLYGGGKLSDSDKSDIGNYAKTGNLGGDEGGTVPNLYPATFQASTNGQPAVTQPQQDLLSLFHGAPQQVASLQPQTNTDFNDIGYLKNDAGIQALLRQKGGMQYSPGEAALDMALLRNNQGFQQGRDQALSAYDQLQAKKSDIMNNSQLQAQDVRNKDADLWKNQVAGEFGNYATDVQNRATAAQGQYNAALPGLQDAGAQQKMASDYMDTLRNDPNLSPDLKPYVNDDPSTLGSYFSNSRDPDANWQDFTSANDASEYNNVMGALGKGGAVLPGQGQFYGSTPTSADALNFNKGAFTNDIMANAATKLKQKQADDQAAAQTAHDAQVKADAAAAAQAAQAAQVSEGQAGVGKMPKAGTVSPIATGVEEKENAVDKALGSPVGQIKGAGYNVNPLDPSAGQNFNVASGKIAALGKKKPKFLGG